MADPVDPFLAAAQEVTREQNQAYAPAPDAPDAGAHVATVDPYEVAAKQVRDDQVREDNMQAQLLNWRAANDKADPAKRADVLRYSAASGLSPSFVEQNLEDVRRDVDAKHTDWNLVAHRQPALVQFMLEQPEVTPLVKDDAAQLGGIEWAMTAPFHAFLDAVNEQRTVALQFQEARGEGSPADQARIRELERQFSNKDYGAEGLLDKALIGTARMVPFLAGDIAARAIGGYVGGVVGGGAGAAAGGAASSPTVVGTPIGAAAGGAGGGITGAGVGAFAGSSLFNYYETVGPLYWRLSNLKDSNGKLLDPEVARAFATGGAITTSVLMAGFLGKLGGKLPGVKQLLAKVGANTVEKALVEQTTQRALASGVKNFGVHWLTGGAMMAAQSAVSAASEESAKSYSGQPFEVHWENINSAAAHGFEQGLTDMFLISALGPGREMLKDIGRARASAESAVRLEAMTNSAAGSKLLERLPEGFQAAVEKMKAKDGAVENVYFPVDEWTRYWQGKKVDPGEVANHVAEDGGKAYADAVATKGDVVIPAEKYLKNLARTEHAAGLEHDMKLRSDEVTPRQFETSQKELKARLDEQAKVRGAEFEDGKKAVRDFIEQSAIGAKVEKGEAKANAKLVSEFAGTLALRLGVSVQEAAAMGALGQLRITGPKGEGIAAAAREKFKEFLKPSARRLLEQRLPTMSAETRANEYYLDKVSGLRNERAFAEPTDGRQVAVITSPDVKGINDHPTAGGHDVTNEMLRAMGAAIGDGHEEAARGGTNFLVHVKDQAELDALLAKVKAKLGNDKLNVVGGLGENRGKAFEALRANETAGREAKTLPARGGLHPELDVAGLKFPADKARGMVPPELVDKIGQLSDEQYAKQAYLDRITVDGKPIETGLLSGDGWNGIPRKAHVASIDLRGLKAANLRFGEETGNHMLGAFAELVAHLGGSSFDAAHLSGDEYAFQHNDPLQLQRFVERIRTVLKDYELTAVDPVSGKPERVPLDFRHGIGRTYAEGDRALNAAKRAEGDTANRAQADRQGGLEPGQQLRGEPGALPEASAGGRSGRPGEVGAVAPEVLADRAGRTVDPISTRDGGRGNSANSSGLGVRGDEVNRQDSADLARAGTPSPADRGRQVGLGRGATRQGFGEEVVAHVEGAPVKYNAGAGERGFIQIQLEPGGKPRAFDIRILAGDKSTLAHETAHFLSWSLHDLATSDLASPDLVRDYQTLFKWAGYGSADERVAQVKERQDLGKLERPTQAQEGRMKALDAKEERISHGWEQYLMEGKAPNRELRGVFSKFKDWLLRIYKGLPGIQKQYQETYGQELGLSDDVRQVFDRLLAADEALQQAQADTGTAATPPPLLTAAMTPDEREQYRRALVAARISAETEMDQARGELEAPALTEARAKMMAEAARELDRQPLYRAMRFLQRGELVDSNGELTEVPELLKDKDGNALKLQRADLVDKFGADTTRRMPAKVFAPTKKGGVPVEQLAPMLGFESGEDLVAAFTRAESRDAALRNLTQDKMDEAFGPTVSKMAEAAMSAVHNADRARATLLEMRALAKSVDPEAANRARSIDLATMRAAAERLIDESALADLDPAHYARVERQTALEQARLIGAGKKAEALDQAEARLFNQLLYRAARDAQAELEKAKERLEKTSDETRGALGKADPTLRDVHDSIIAAVGLGEAPVEPKTIDELVAFVNQNELQASFDVDVPAIRKLLSKPYDWDNLNVAEARTVDDAVKNLRHMARQLNELELNGQKETRDGWFKDVESHLAKQKPLPVVPLDKAAQGLGDKLRHLGRGADALLTDVPESLSHSLDGGDRAGPMHRLFVDGRLECRDTSVKLSGAVLKPILEKAEDIPKDVRKLGDKRVDVAKLLPVPPGGERRFAPVYTRQTLWMLFLNWGNEGNRQRIRDGMGWTDDNIGQALNLLTKPELKFLQGVLDTVNSLWPDVQRVHEKRTGLKLDKVESTPITINGEEYSGGYFPLKADRRFNSRAGQMQEGADIKSAFGPNYERAFTPSSHRKERAERAVYPVDLQWGVVPAHLSQVIHDIAYGDWVRQVAGVIRDKRFLQLVDPHLGEARTREFMPWLADVANAKADSAAGAQSEFLQQLGAFARNRAAVAVMGMNLPAILPQVLDPWNAAQENVPARHIAAAYVKVNTHLAGMLELPELQLSKELKYRDEYLKVNLREQLGKLGPSGRGIGRAVSEVAFALYELSDKYTSRVTWKAAFDHAQGDGLPDVEAAARADDVVRRAYATHDVAEKPPLMRSKRGAAAAVMFYGFANRLYNSLRRTVTDTRLAFGDDAEPGDRVRAVARVGAKLMMMGLTGAAFAYLAGRGPKKDEDPKKWLAWKVALEPFNTVPFLGPALEGLSHGQKPSMRTAPELALLEQTLGGIGEAAQKARQSRSAQDAVIAAVEALIGPTMALAGLPAAQLQRTGGYGLNLATGNARPRRGAAGALDVAGGLYYGERKDQPRNPISDLADAVR